MPGQVRLDSPGTLHHVIVRGIEKRDIVEDKLDRKDFHGPENRNNLSIAIEKSAPAARFRQPE